MHSREYSTVVGDNTVVGAASVVYREADGVLNVHTMAIVGRQLGPGIEEVEIPGGLHDLVLSRRDVREMVYNIIFEWLRRFQWQ